MVLLLRIYTNTMTGKAFGLEQFVQMIDQKWVVNGRSELNVTHMSGTVGGVKTASDTTMISYVIKQIYCKKSGFYLR